MDYSNIEFKVDLANLNDKEEILKLLDKVFSTQQMVQNISRGISFWNWKYENNPFGQAKLHKITLGEKIVGCGTLWPFEFIFNGKVLKAYQPCDTVILKEYRGKGLFSNLNKKRIATANQENFDFIFNFPNSQSLPGYQKMGWVLIGKIQWYVKVLQPLKVFNSFLVKSKSEILNVPEIYSLNLKEKFVDNSFLEHKINLIKNEDFFSWRFKSHPNRNYGILTIEEQFAIFTLMKKGVMIEMVVVEFNVSEKFIPKMIKFITKEAKKMNVSYIALPNPNSYSKWHFYKNQFFLFNNKNFVVKQINKTLPPEIFKLSNWNFTLAMHDSI
jgi:hypothetical protein